MPLTAFIQLPDSTPLVVCGTQAIVSTLLEIRKGLSVAARVLVQVMLRQQQEQTAHQCFGPALTQLTITLSTTGQALIGRSRRTTAQG